MQVYELVRRSVLAQGKSVSQVSQELGLNWRTVKKMTQEPVPPGYRLSSARGKPVLGPFMDRIEQILSEDAAPKQRHTARRVFERLVDEDGYTGGETQVRAYVSELRSRPKEAFVPLVSFPGEAEADFKESVVEIGGKRLKAHCFVMVLPFSGVWFCACYPAENAESFADGHARAFKLFCGTPRRIVYDNASYSVKRGSGRLKGRERKLTDSFQELQSAFAFEAEFATAGKGNEKGSVERKVATIRSKLFVPVPKAGSWEELNEMLQGRASALRDASELFAQDAARLVRAQDYEPSRLVSAKVDKLGLVCFQGCFYSVPTSLVGRSVLVRARPFELEILSESQTVATHKRCFEKGRATTQLWHYLDLLEHKPRAVHRALPVVQAGLPIEYEAFRQRVYDGTGIGDRRFVAVLRLAQEFGIGEVREVLAIANARGLKDAPDIRLLALRQMEPALAKQTLSWEKKTVTVERGNLSEYAKLLEVAS